MEQKVEVRFTICFDEQETREEKEQKERKQLPKKYQETKKKLSHKF